MNRLVGMILLASLFALAQARAQGPDDQYVSIYNLIQQADALSRNAEPAQALIRYREAQSALQRLQQGYPDWNARVVGFRLNYLASKIADLTPVTPSPMPSAPTQTTAPVPPPAIGTPNRQAPAVSSSTSRPSPTAGAAPATRPLTLSAPPTPAATDQTTAPRSAPIASPGTAASEVSALKNQADALQNQVRQLQADKSSLEAKLKEALSAQPAAMDPRELARAEEQVKTLQKENGSLKASLAQEKSKPATATNTKGVEEARQALAEANARLKDQTEKADLLALEKQALQNQLNNLQRASRPAPASAPSSSSDANRKALEDANRKLAQQTALATQLAADKQSLESRLSKSNTDSEAAAALRLENQVLKKQLAELKTTPTSTPKGEDPRRQLAQAQAQIALLQSDKELLRLEKLALENRVKQLSGPAVASSAPPATGRPAESSRLRELEQERDNLRKQLALATQDAKSRKDKASVARVQEMEDQVAALRAQLAVFEARRAPYSSEELALFNQPAPQLAQTAAQTATKTSRNSPSEMPAGSATLVAEAHRYFVNRQFDKAEERYLEVLRQDDKNVYTLANLAAIQLELNHLDEAERHVQQALAQAPGDAYSLLILGQVKLRQDKYDDSLDALSRAAKADPESPQIQNFLGVTLSHKGLRVPAETALRKAIELDPGYASAHNNLAVVYVTQQPPAVALARWHYQKALAAGHPRNPELEKMLDAPLTADSGK